MEKKAKIIRLLMTIVAIILLIIVIIAYRYIYNREKSRAIYAEESEKFVEENQSPIFKINKIVLYSSANTTDNSENEELKNLDISQFTDIEIYIDNTGNGSELTAENTVNTLTIDDIKISSEDYSGEKILNYKNPNNCGKYVALENYKGNSINFKVNTNNTQNEFSNYDENIFYTDCSNPISLGYINKNIISNAAITSTGALSLDGSILKLANIDLKKIAATIEFTIHLTNNYNEAFMCKVKIDNELEEKAKNESIYSGYFMKILNFEDEYTFLKETK